MKLMKFGFALAIATMMTGIGLAQDVDQAGSGVVYVTVIGNTSISGSIEDLTSIKLNTSSFGDVQIPIAKIDGIKMNADGKDGAVVALRNGDMVTGKITVDRITVKTDWGKAHINTNAIQTMTSTKGARFVSDGSGSGGWRFNRPQPNQRTNPGRAPNRQPFNPNR